MGNDAIGTKEYVAVEVYLHIFLISVLGDGDRFTRGKDSRTAGILGTEGRVDTTADLDIVEKIQICCNCRKSKHERSAVQTGVY